MDKVRAKKHLGQHFLNDRSIAENIANALSGEGYDTVLEIGPGMGVLTQFLLQRNDFKTHVVEIDRESVEYLNQHYPALHGRIHSDDFLKMDLTPFGTFGLIGNFPYNISSQIMFRMIDYKEQIPEMAGMFQKEVAERFNAKPSTKAYGILSVLLQAHYDCEYLFTVHEHVFTPPPKVKSGVVRLKRKADFQIPVDPVLFKQIVKAAFNQRRKTMRNSLRLFNLPDGLQGWDDFAKLRPEQLSVEAFFELTDIISKFRNS
ncbi:MAG: 16S rRNA (adenine(1518)-N(6)/adenine(1519)-N(6))-dimethyltransferase RsmA [Bacteroidetes bacterium]|nr:MAG: 16S rRNA (adenine(1518)-N(6)/adenine(1519)-N(6))-dimethyltransferase RsmA [Bacteroidota bacterium]